MTLIISFLFFIFFFQFFLFSVFLYTSQIKPITHKDGDEPRSEVLSFPAAGIVGNDDGGDEGDDEDGSNYCNNDDEDTEHRGAWGVTSERR